jgi:predicted Zn-dependent peptidase
VSLSVFVRAGSQHETRRLNGISHFVEHMAFKGTHERDCQRINLDAERLGAEVNAHTDKDHTAFHIEGLARDAGAFVHMLGDIVQNSSFPQAELERERQVILHELTEDAEDPMSTAFKLFDRACHGDHPVGRPVIGTRANILRISRDDLLAYVRRQYTASNVVVSVAGHIDPDDFTREAQAAFGAMPVGKDNRVAEPAHLGGIKTRRVGGSAQSHLVLGFPVPSLKGDHLPFVVAAALFGEGMSSPLLDQIRERRGLAYHAACSADVAALCGQFVIEASTAPEHLEEIFVEIIRLLRDQAEGTDPIALDRARNQLTVRALRALEHAARRLESAAQDLFAFGHLRSTAQWLERLQSVTAAEVRDAFGYMLGTRAAVAMAGRIPARASDSIRGLFASA